MLSAQSLIDEIQFYAPTDLLQFPDWETLPYDLFSLHQDIISQRLATLYKLPNIERGALCLPVNTLMQRLAPVDYIINNSILFAVGEIHVLPSVNLLLILLLLRLELNIIWMGDVKVI